MNTKLEVWLVRHGETEWSLSGQHSGRNDLPLTSKGEDEARAVGTLLGGRTFDQVWCSPLQRARRTCELAGYASQAITDPELQEWDYGDCTGLTMAQIREIYPDWTIWDGPVPNGESIDQIAARARRVISHLRQCHGSVVLFAHGHFLRILTTQWLEFPPQTARHFILETSSLCILSEESGAPAIRAWNVRTHF